MGWSCRAEAGATLDVWTAYCVRTTGAQNTYHVRGRSFFFEVSNREHPDGRITGKIMRNVTRNPDGSGTCLQVATFCINPDGTVKRAPAALLRLGVGVPRSIGVGSGW